ncbi:DNA repair protein RecO [Eggerthellaceae bacterium 3-80]|nr:DNA repair protein RecO [bacterium D16-34]
MSSPTYSCRGIVLKKTKLGESDLILTFLLENGAQLQAVAKGARKPGAFAARLELYSCVDMLIVSGKSLDIVKEVRIVESNESVRSSLERATCASVMAELLEKVTHVGLEHDRLFALSKKAFETLGRVDVTQVLAIMNAHILKTLALIGFKPTFDVCVMCGEAQFVEDVPLPHSMNLAIFEGGVVCNTCAGEVESVFVPTSTIRWCHFLLMTTFKKIIESPIDRDQAMSVARVCQSWILAHVGIKLKSLNFLFTANIF